MVDKQPIPWVRIVAESAAIIFSILIAFSLEEWRGERQDRETERDDLARLHAEFVWNRDRVNDNRSANRAQAASAEMYTLVVAHLGSDEPLTVDNVLLNDVGASPTFDAVTPVLNGLITSGRLEHIRDQEVLTAISWWQRSLKQVEETEVNARAFMTNHLGLALNRRGNMGPMRRETDSSAVTTISVDNELVGLVAQRADNTNSAVRGLERLKAAANDLVVAIEKAQSE